MAKPINTASLGYGFESLCSLDHAPRYSSQARFDFCMLRRQVVDKVGYPDEVPEELIESFAQQCSAIRLADAKSKRSGEPEYNMIRYTTGSNGG